MKNHITGASPPLAHGLRHLAKAVPQQATARLLEEYADAVSKLERSHDHPIPNEPNLARAANNLYEQLGLKDERHRGTLLVALRWASGRNTP